MNDNLIRHLVIIIFMTGMLQLIGCNKKVEEQIPVEMTSSETVEMSIADLELVNEKWLENNALAMLHANGMDMEKAYYISQEYTVMRETENDDTILFVFCEEKCVGELWVNKKMKSCSLFQTCMEEITSVNNENIEISVVAPDADHMYVIRADGGKEICIYGIPSYGNSEINNKSIDFSAIALRLLNMP